jgi:aspartate/methionine/tyrosine aminotransferase
MQLGVKPALRWGRAPKALPEDQERNRKMMEVQRQCEKEGKPVINMWEGDPVIFGHTNPKLSKHLVEAAEKGLDMYLGVSGCLPELIKAISGFEKKYRGCEYSPEDIIVTQGVAGAFAIIHDALLDPGDVIIGPDPSHYVGLPTSYFYAYEARCIGFPCLEEDEWRPDLDKLRASITDKTKAITIVSPNNPCGNVYDDRTLKSIIDIAGEHDIPVVSDEIYGLLTFDGVEAKSAAYLAGDVPVIVLNGMAKIFQRTGWYIGYICFHDPKGRMTEVKNAIRAVSRLYGHYSQRIPTPIVYAATKAYEGDLDASKEMVKKLQERRDYTMKRLSEIKGISCFKPKAALYAFPRVDAIGRVWKTDDDFIYDFLKEEKVRFTPGRAFGKLGAGHFRTLLLPDMKTLEMVYDRLASFMKRHVV